MNEFRKQVDEYAKAVVNGNVVAGRYVVMACRRYLSDLKRQRSKSFPFKLDEERATNQILFLQDLKHTKGQWAGKPFILSPSQLFIAWNVFGWVNKETELRRFSHAYITVARKWGKSTFVAAICLTLLFFDYPIEVEAEAYVAATKEEQAQIVHTQAVRMCKGHKELNEISTPFKYRDKFKSMVIDVPPYNGSVFKPLGSDSDKTDGLNPSLIVKDELHEWKEHHRDLKAKLETGGGSRLQPLDLTITTAGADDSQLWIEQDTYCVKVLETADTGNCIDERMFSFIARIDETRPCDCGGKDDCQFCDGSGQIPGDDPLDEGVWKKANPDLGVTPTLDYLQNLAVRAKHDKSFLSDFTRYHANARVRSTFKIISPHAWADCKSENAEHDPSEWLSGTIWGAWDLGLEDDLAAIAAVSRIERDGQKRYLVKALGFCPEDAKRDLTREPWASWIEQGLLIPTMGTATDIPTIRKHIVSWRDEFGVGRWAFDPSNSRQLGQELETNHGMEAFKFVQTFGTYNEPIRALLRAIKEQTIEHDGNDLLAWAVCNLVVKRGNRDDMMPDKRKSQEKIDPAVAMLMAFGQCVISPGKKVSVYKRRGVLTA